MFEGFDDVQVPDQWDEITNRAAGPGDPGLEPGNGRRMAIVAAAAAAVVGLAAVLWVGLARDDDLSTVNPPADTVPPSMEPATTAPPTTASPGTAPWTSAPTLTVEPPPATVGQEYPPPTSAPATTAPPTESAFDCQESMITGEPDGVHEDDPSLGAFGPIGAAPAVDITTNATEILNESAGVVRVDGGTAIVVQARYDQRPGWSLTVVNDDGTIRWRRCGFEHELAGLFATPAFLVLSEIDASTGFYAVSRSRPLLDLSSGADSGTMEIPSSMESISAGEHRYRLFGDRDAQPTATDAGLLLLDTETMATTEIPYPPDYFADGQYGAWIDVVETPDDPTGWILLQYGSEHPVVASVYVDGSWSSDPEVIRSVVPVRAYSPYGMGSAWTGVDGLGAVVWTVPDKVAFWAEGPWKFEDASIDLLVSCDSYDFDTGSRCVSPSLLGVDRASGTLLWELPGHRQVAAVGDGYAIVTDGTGNLEDGTQPGTWFMIDTSTGLPIDGQTWSYDTFGMDYYSMENDGRWVVRAGGVVVAVNGDHVRVWMPAATSTGTVNVSLAR